jgi:hypothetical protein
MDHVLVIGGAEPREAEHLLRTREHLLSASNRVDLSVEIAYDVARTRAGAVWTSACDVGIGSDDARIIGKLTPS